MRICLLFIAVVSLGLAGCGKKSAAPSATTSPSAAAGVPVDPPNLIARWHFTGSAAFAADTNAVVLRRVLGLPETAEFRYDLLEKLSGVPFTELRLKTAQTTNGFAEVIHPLLDDLVTAESFGEMTGESNAIDQAVLAIHLNDDRAAAWSASLSNILASWTALTPVATDPKSPLSWDLKKHQFPNLARVVRAGDWLVLGVGQDKIPLLEEIVQRIKAEGRPTPVATDYWVNVAADSVWLTRALKLPPAAGLPPGRIELKCFGDGGDVRTKGRFVSTQPLRWQASPWTVPTNLIREPLISFTAAQGLAARFGEFPQFKQHELPAPDQLYVWALAKVPFQTFVAFPVADPSNTLVRLASQFQTNTPARLGTLNLDPTNATLTWNGLPFVAPKIEAVQDDTGGFFLLGLFPNNPKKSPLPPELLAQFKDRTNLVYYDWEITDLRLAELRTLAQLADIIHGRSISSTNELGQRWLTSIAPQLGNTVTEITQTSANELAFIRKSPAGFTAMELTLFTEWINSANFPAAGLLRPARSASSPKIIPSQAQ